MKHVLRLRRGSYLQTARHYSPSSFYQASKPSPIPHSSRSAQPSAAPLQSRLKPSKVSRAPKGSKPSRKPHSLRSVQSPTVPQQSQPNLSHVPQTPRKNCLRRSCPKSRLRNWAKNHRYIVRALGIIGCGTVIFFCASPRVPITGRRQLAYIPRRLKAWYEDLSRKEIDEMRKAILKCSWGSEHPDMQGPIAIFNRLLHAAGLDDGQLEFRVIQAPGK